MATTNKPQRNWLSGCVLWGLLISVFLCALVALIGFLGNDVNTAGNGAGGGTGAIANSGPIPTAQATEVLSDTKVLYGYQGKKVALFTDQSDNFTLAGGDYLMEWGITYDVGDSSDSKATAYLTL